MAASKATSAFLPLVEAWLDGVSQWWLRTLDGVSYSDAAVFTVRIYAYMRSYVPISSSHTIDHPLQTHPTTTTMCF